MRIAAVIVNHNNADLLRTALRSLAAQELPLQQIVVVDNASSDSSRELVRWEFPTVTLLEHSSNRGFAEANNWAIQHAFADPSIESILMMNSDARAASSVTTALSAALDAHARIGAVQAKMLFPSTPRRLYSAGGFVAARDFRILNRGYGEIDRGQYDVAEEIFCPCAGAALYRRSFLEDTALATETFFDSSYFAYLEDVDLACRGHLRGWQFRYEPRAVVTHLEAATSSRLPPGTKEYLSRRNRLWTVIKTFPVSLALRVGPRYLVPTSRGARAARADSRAPRLSVNAAASVRAITGTIVAAPRLLRTRRRIRERMTTPNALRTWFFPPRSFTVPR